MSATPISGATGFIDGDNSAGTLEPGEGALLYDVDNGLYGDLGFGGGRTVWYEWPCPATGDYAFWTGATDGTFDFLGLGDSIVTVMDGDNFFTDNVIAQNEFAEGKPGGLTVFPWSLVEFSATIGNTYFIAVDGYNGLPPSDGGYDINDTYEGPFRLYWGAAVDALPAIRNCSIISVGSNSAEFQFEVNPQSPNGGDYWARASVAGAPVFDASHGHESAGFAWTTVTSTVTGLAGNTFFGANSAFVENDIYENDTDCDDFYTTMPEAFGSCAPDEADSFTGPNCTSPAGWTVSDGYRIQDNALGAYDWMESNNAVWSGINLGPGLSPRSGDAGATLSVVGGKQDIGFAETAAFPIRPYNGYFVRSDSGQMLLYRLDAEVEVLLASAGVAFGDGDRIGIRFDNTLNTVSGWRFDGNTWTMVVSAVDATYSTDTIAFQAFLRQSADTGPPAIDDADVYDLSLYGTSDGTLGCPAGTDKYTWDTPPTGVGFHVWSGPYFGGSDPNSYPNPAQACPNWYLDLKVHARGRIDCALESIGNSGDDAFMQSYFSGTLGITAALIPFYPLASEYDSELDAYEADEFGGFLTWDTDFAHKGIDAIQSTLDTVQAAFAADGAHKVENIGDGGRHSYGVFMPVKVAAGRIDNFFLSLERCIPGIVGFSGCRLPRPHKARLH